ncbi:MAG: M36 family metallopeptidase, partial [Lewinella sp.]|nr:M36 family metallopeptidase [Lewinella sp.]
VTDAMKLQACSPGFIDGRDAILMADSLAYDGIHQCLLWEVFARRGLGYYAQQNSRYNRNDGFEDFTVKPSCITELKIAKSVDQPLILPGDDVTVYLTVTNDKLEDATNVVVTDQLPDGLTYLPGSAQGADVAVMGNTLTFGLGDLIPGEVHTFQYQVSSDPLRFSAQQFFDGMEDGDGNWTFANLQGINIWDLTTNNPYEGDFAWYVPNADTQNDQVLELIEPFTVNGDHPVFRFYHRYQTSPGEAGGLVQISTDGGATWSFVPEQFIRNGYRGRLSYFTFTIPGLDAFWGDSNSYLDSYIDLTPYLGQTINLRFRFGSDDQVGLFGGGWYVDNVEIMDLYSYQWETCATSSEGDTPCAILPEGGIFVESGMFSPAEDLTLDPARIKVYPNPTRDRLNLRFTGQWSGQAQLQLHTLHGVRVRTWQQALSENALLELDVDGVPPGLYLLEIRTPEGQHVSKVTVQ